MRPFQFSLEYSGFSVLIKAPNVFIRSLSGINGRIEMAKYPTCTYSTGTRETDDDEFGSSKRWRGPSLPSAASQARVPQTPAGRLRPWFPPRLPFPGAVCLTYRAPLPQSGAHPSLPHRCAKYLFLHIFKLGSARLRCMTPLRSWGPFCAGQLRNICDVFLLRLK